VRWTRRAVSLPALVLATIAWLALLPALLVLGALRDLVGRRPWVTVRCVLFFALYLGCELLGVVAAFAVWLASGVWAGASRRRFLAWNVALQALWARTLYRGAARLFGIHAVVEGPERVRGPLLVFVRHVSTADTVLPVVFLAVPNGLALRYVLKRELLWDPCLDIVGNRLPNAFVRRGSGESAHEIAAVERLLDDLGPRDGVLIFPEGSRFTAAKRERVLARLAARDPRLHRRAERLRSVLPPHHGGPLGLLEKNEAADVVFFAHRGFERAATLWDLLNGSLVGATVRIRFWRVPLREIPKGREARLAWLYEHWQRVDEWVSATPASGLRSQQRA